MWLHRSPPTSPGSAHASQMDCTVSLSVQFARVPFLWLTLWLSLSSCCDSGSIVVSRNLTRSHLPPPLKHSVCFTLYFFFFFVFFYVAWVSALCGITATSEFFQHVQPVCFGPDTWTRVSIWVKVRSVSVALVGTLRHLLSLPLCQTLTDTHFLAGRQVDLSGWECGSCHLSKVEVALASHILLWLFFFYQHWSLFLNTTV